MKKPKLLLPAGTPEALEAAINAGADEIYLGGKEFNARLGAANFTNEQIARAIMRCHFFGVSVFVTLNTLLTDRELPEALRFVDFLYVNDCDGLIVTDPALTEAIRLRYPDFELHASTQCAAHNVEAVKILTSRGFSRVVLARECSWEDVEKIRAALPEMEYEIFIHGALCVCHSGMCEYSANLGGRSGNRGECAQPCRLPDAEGNYPLSLKDNCLAGHMKTITESGIDCLKVEGRMKSPEYVYGVGKVYLACIDECRDATEEELDRLQKLFSRGGFTDAYFTGKISADMLGARSEEDKERTRQAETTEAYKMRLDKKRIPVSVSAQFRLGQVSRLSLSARGKTVIVYGDAPEKAISSPLTEEDVIKNLCRFGNTPFAADRDSFTLYLDRDISLPISAINSLRRTAVERLTSELPYIVHPGRAACEATFPAPQTPDKPAGGKLIAHFTHSSRMPSKLYLGQFSHIFLPVDEYLSASEEVRSVTDGITLPPVVMQSELELLDELLIRAKLCGVKNAEVCNIGTLRAAKKYGFTLWGGIGLNVYNTRTASVLAGEGLSYLLLCPELKLAQLRVVASGSPVTTGAAVYGKLPLTVLEKCVIRDLALGKSAPAMRKCRYCDNNEYTYITDRTGAEFPLRREFIHRNVMYNSVPIYMADKLDAVIGGTVGDLHFFFTDETANQAGAVIDAYRTKAEPTAPIRRM